MAALKLADLAAAGRLPAPVQPGARRRPRRRRLAARSAAPLGGPLALAAARGARRRRRCLAAAALVGDRPGRRLAPARRGRWLAPSRSPRSRSSRSDAARAAARPAGRRAHRPARLGAPARRLAGARPTSPASAPRPRADPFAALPPRRSCRRSRGTDVLVVFVESYGRSALDNPRYAADRRPRRSRDAEAAPRRRAASPMRSGWLTAPMVGGQSWLAHASAALGPPDRQPGPLPRAARQPAPHAAAPRAATPAGRPAAVMPAITLAWPEAGWFGYDRVLAAARPRLPRPAVQLGDDARPVHARRLRAAELLGRRRAPPVFAEIALISSHAPWTPIPPLLPWEAIGDGRVFDRLRHRRRPAGGRLARPTTASATSTASRSTTRCASSAASPRAAPRDAAADRRARRPPAGAPSSRRTRRAATCRSTSSARPTSLARSTAGAGRRGWSRPPDAPAWPMDAFRDRFLAAFATAPAHLRRPQCREPPGLYRRRRVLVSLTKPADRCDWRAGKRGAADAAR